MAYYPIQTNFTAGELSPRLALRIDFNKYANGLSVCENYLPLPHGGVTRRPGTRFVKEVFDSSKDTRLMPFEFSTTQAYILEWGNLYVRFYRDGGRIESTKTITNAADNGSTLIRITSNNHGYTNGMTVTITGVTGTTEANGTWAIQGVTANTFDLAATTFVHAYVSGGTAVGIVSAITPYAEAALFDLQYAQSADTLYLTHRAYAPRKLTRTSHTDWTLAEIDFLDGPYLDENLIVPNGVRSGVSITNSGTSGSITLTATGSIFAATDVGRLVRMKEGSDWRWLKITAYTSGTQVTATVKGDAFGGSGTPLSTWRLGAWSTTTGYPTAVTFFEDRLMFAGSTAQPQTVWGSVSGDYEDFTPGAEDSDAITYTIASNQVNAITWLSSAVGLLIGTVGGEFAMFGGQDAPLSPTNVTVRRQSTHGSLDGAAPITIGTSTLFIQRSGRKIRELKFNAEGGVYTARDLTLLAEHVTTSGVYQMSYQQEPDSVVWIIRGDGMLLSLTYKPEEEVIAFARHITTGFFESVATIPSPDGTADQTWVIVRRTVDGNTKRYVEYFDTSLYVDSGLTYSGAATDTVSGLSHLEGLTVAINGDGAVYPEEAVDAGVITLDGPEAESIQVGSLIAATLTILRPEVKMANGGTSQGRKKRWVELFVRMFESLGVSIKDDTVPFRTSADPMDSAPPLFTGDKRATVSGWDRDGQFSIRQEQPLPSTILGYFGTLDVGEQSE